MYQSIEYLIDVRFRVRLLLSPGSQAFLLNLMRTSRPMIDPEAEHVTWWPFKLK